MKETKSSEKTQEKKEDMFKYANKNRLLFLQVVFLILLFAVAELGKAYFMGALFNAQIEMKKVLELVGVVIVFLLMYTIISSLKDYSIQKYENKVRYDLQKEMYSFALRESPEQFLKKDSSAFINQITNKTNEIVEKYIHSKILMINLVLSFLIGSFYVGANSWIILMFLYGCAGACIGSNRVFAKPLKKSQKVLSDHKERWIQTVKNFYKNFLFIRNENYESHFTTVLDRENKNLENSYNKANGLFMVSDAVNGGLGQYMFIGTIIIGAILIHQGQLNVPTVLALSQVTNMVVNPIFQFATLKNCIDASRFLLEELREEQKAIKQQNQKETKSVSKIDCISFDHLDFGYPNGKVVFQDINYTFEKGSKTLIVGASGEGKSTLLKLLLKQISNQSIKVNNIRLDQVKYNSYFSDISYVSQNIALFPMSLKENILLKQHKKVAPILDQVNLSDLKERENEIFDSDAMTLSGGQIQRILLARAIAAGKDWLVFDEAFSAIDETTRKKIESIFLEDPNKTVISVSHKIDFGIARSYDTILLVENGKLTPITIAQLREWMEQNR
ncbi:hypothetical protein C815_00359 [Firmicutes bacterium M10-2]|nr:hypothetical protein C815_00359 [Firmicutes bacterium M10-2]